MNQILQIDAEFKNLIPPLSSEEKLQLEANLKEFGCLDPLIVWQGEDILLDGHNRYEICIREQIPYNIVEIDITDREAALSWIANHQLGRRNITPEIASYLRGKRYLNLRGDRIDNLRQNSPKCKSCTSVESDGEDLAQSENLITLDAAKRLAQQYKVSVRTIKNDARFTDALDTLARSLGEEIKHSILTRNSGLTRKDILLLAQVAEEEGQESVQKLLSMKRNKLDIVQQIKDKNPLPNPYHIGEVCRILPSTDPDLKPFSGCWCIVYEINPHSCGVKTWKANLATVKPEYLERIDATEEEIANRNCGRIQSLVNKVNSDYEPIHAVILELLGKIHDPSSLTPKQERMLSFLESEY
ncbi:hypothetical protein [Calothrix sp. PCC 6303]|uniref:hypothetical protein n=1 Tax=Calothrix sp. PCC 6303 TaxID=1170562 RepID=UPI0002A04D69|nr:hypothetical protein [Calothrix sp. PCC 6303]AFZ01226.1 hypothetical protein Cal6303_2206 [Calothrix sp. PCC 6303]